MTVNNSILDKFVVERRVESATLDRLRALSDGALFGVEQLISRLQPSVNWLRDVLDLTDEIAARDKIDVAEVLNDPQLQAVLTTDLGRKDKQKRYRYILEARRFPRRAEIERRLRELQREISRVHGCRLEFPEDLEGDHLQCTVVFRSSAELGDVAKRFQGLERSGCADEMLRLLRGEIGVSD